MLQLTLSFCSLLMARLLSFLSPEISTDTMIASRANSTGTNRSVTSASPVVLSSADLIQIPIESFAISGRGDVSWRTIISAPSTVSDTFTVGIATCRPYTGHLALHKHKQAEIYHIISGVGIIRIEREKFWVRQGHVVFIPSNMEHGVYNTGSEELKWLYSFAANGFQDVVYHFSGEEVRDTEESDE